VLDFEVKHKEEVERPQSLTVGIPIQHRDQPTMPEEIPFESGSVLRQKNEIEMKYGSSPRPSKLSPDHNLSPPSVSPTDAARLTPTLEKYCASDIKALTEEVPEGFLDEDGEGMQDLRNDLTEPSHFPDQDLPESHHKQEKILSDAGSQFQRSFSYRENGQQKQSKKSPFFSRSASLRSRWSSNVTKNDNSVVAFSPCVVAKTTGTTLSVASFSSTEVCRRLLKEKNQQNECASADKLSDDAKESKQVKHAGLGTEKDREVLVSDVLNTLQLHGHSIPAALSTNSTVSRQVESGSGVICGNCKYDLHQLGNQSLKTNVAKTVELPAVCQDQQTVPASAFVSKVGPQQSMSHSSRTGLSVEPSALSDKDKQPSSLAGTGSSDCVQPAARNTDDEDTVRELVDDELAVNSGQSQSTQQPMQVDASSVVSKSVVHSVEPLPLGQLNEASSVTQFVASQPLSAEAEQRQMSELIKRFSFNDKSTSFIPAEPGKVSHSQSVHDKSSSFLQLTAGVSEQVDVQKVKKLYGRSHPLSKLSSEYLSRDSSQTIKDCASDHHTT